MATEWYWMRQDEEQGPVSFRELAMLVQQRVVNELDLVRTGGLSQKWEKAYRVPGLFYMAQRVAEPPPETICPDPPDFAEATALESIPWDECESVQGSGVELYSGAEDGAATNWVNIVDEMAASRELRTGSDEFESPPESNGEIATAITAATEDWDRRHAAPLVTEGESHLVGPRYSVFMAPFVWCGSVF